jgi:hypothetical protein
MFEDPYLAKLEEGNLLAVAGRHRRYLPAWRRFLRNYHYNSGIKKCGKYPPQESIGIPFLFNSRYRYKCNSEDFALRYHPNY